MGCDVKNHQNHMCVLKSKGLNDCIEKFSDHPIVECKKCGAQANSPKHLCAAHLGDWAHNGELGKVF